MWNENDFTFDRKIESIEQNYLIKERMRNYRMVHDMLIYPEEVTQSLKEC